MSTDSPTDRPHFLLVEANTDLRVGLAAWLRQEFPSCIVQAASNLARAEKLLGASSPDVILVDVDERQGGGFAALRRFRETAPAAHRVAVSQYPTEYFEYAAMRAGADLCVCIVLTDNRLRELLRRLLQRTERTG